MHLFQFLLLFSIKFRMTFFLWDYIRKYFSLSPSSLLCNVKYLKLRLEDQRDGVGVMIWLIRTWARSPTHVKVGQYNRVPSPQWCGAEPQDPRAHSSGSIRDFSKTGIRWRTTEEVWEVDLWPLHGWILADTHDTHSSDWWGWCSPNGAPVYHVPRLLGLILSTAKQNYWSLGIALTFA